MENQSILEFDLEQSGPSYSPLLPSPPSWSLTTSALPIHTVPIPTTKSVTSLPRKPPQNKQKPYICFIPFPYCQDDNATQKSLPPILKLRRQIPSSSSSLYKSRDIVRPLMPIDIPVGETPINEYLDYVLAQEINIELRGAKVLAQEVKRIKEEKKNSMMVQRETAVKRVPKRNLSRKQKLVGHSFLLKVR